MKTLIFLISLVILRSEAENTEQQIQSTSRPGVDQTMLRGIWWSSEMPQSAAFQIDDSTFYYPEHFVRRRYRIKGDSLNIFFEDGSILSSAVVKLTPDTLILSTYGKLYLYTRTEPQR